MIKIAGQTSSNQRKGWYEYDTGAQTHMTNEKWRLTNPRPYNNGVQGHDGHITQAELIGDITLPHKGKNIILRNVLTVTNSVTSLVGYGAPKHAPSREPGTKLA